MSKIKITGMALLLSLVVQPLWAELSVSTFPSQALVFCASCASNHASTITVNAPDLSDGEMLAISLTHQGGLHFSTGFPYMIGQVLVEGNFPVKEGKVVIQTHFPIRGGYQLRASGKAQQVVKNIRVREPALIQKRIVVLFVVLAVLGLIAGYIFGRASGHNMAVGLLMICLVAAGSLNAHGGKHEGEGIDLVRSKQVGPWQVQMSFLPDPAPVGQVTYLSLKLINKKTGHVLKNASVGVSVDLLEYGVMVFGATTKIKDGKAEFAFGYFDGSPHQVNYTIKPDNPKQESFKVSFQNKVAAKSPPMSAKLGTLGVFMLVMLVGFIVGFKFASPAAD